MTGPEAHHELGASGAYRWLACPGSVPAQRGKGDSSSVYAEEGTSAHELAEHSLGFWKLEEGSTRGIQDWRKAADAAGYDTKEMTREVKKYTEYIKDLCGGDPETLTVEMRVGFGDLIPGGFGTSDTVVLIPDSLGTSVGTVHVADLKYGKGKQVYAANNPQLRLYAYGAVLGLIEQGVLDADFDDFRAVRVELHICQPRTDHFDSETLTVTELMAWAEEVVRPAVDRIVAHEDETRVAGSHCDFCKAQATCKKVAQKHAADLETDWDDFIEEGPGTPGVNELTPEEIGKLLKLKSGIEKWFKALQEHGHTTIENGGDIPEWKLVQGNKNRSWDDDEAVLEAFKGQRALKQDEYAPRKLITCPQADKLLPEKSKIRAHIVEGRNKPSLVRSSNKKPALVFKPAEDMFDDEEDEYDDL